MLRKVVLTPFILALAGPALAAYDANEILLGATEQQVKERFPYANCRALEWQSRAADRRCDDSRINFGGIDARVTFYLRHDSVEGFDVRFDSRELARMSEFLRARYGKPAAEGSGRVKLQWKSRGERAVLSADPGRRRASLLVWRGAFEEEIYKVR